MSPGAGSASDPSLSSDCASQSYQLEVKLQTETEARPANRWVAVGVNDGGNHNGGHHGWPICSDLDDLGLTHYDLGLQCAKKTRGSFLVITELSTDSIAKQYQEVACLPTDI